MLESNRAATCAFTGHRPEKMPFTTAKFSYGYRSFQASLDEEVQKSILSGYSHFITGMSRGMDLWAAVSVVKFKRAYSHVTLEAAIPCPEQCEKWNIEDLHMYSDVLACCDKKTVVCPKYVAGCMQKRNRYMVDSSSLLIAAFDGSAGGTKNTVEYAARKNIQIINLLDGHHNPFQL